MTLDDHRVQGATDREMLTFLGRVRALYNIDWGSVPEFTTQRDWNDFRRNPPWYLVNVVGPRKLRAIWREVERIRAANDTR